MRRPRERGYSRRVLVTIRRRAAQTRRATRGALVAWVGLGLWCLGLSGCKREVTRQHEELALALKEPLSLLCAMDPHEGGGCVGMCQTWAAVNEAHDYAVASQALANLPPFADAATETLLATVRAKAQGVGAVLGNVCLTNFAELRNKPHDSESLPRITTCAEAEAKSGPAVAELRRALTELEAQTQARTGVALPRHNFPCGDVK